jgi:glycosyltransferase involved in cell wall biosynthesis
MRYLVDGPEKKVIVVMPAYNASRTLKATLEEIPQGTVDEIILVDDASKDDTVERARELVETVVVHPKNRGYGGNQKTCYRTALDHGADIIVMVHPDNQYNPKLIPNMVLPIYLGQADVVLASRFIQDPLRGGPVAGGMPLLKYFVNRGMTTVQNWLMGTFFSEFHTGYRAFSREALETIDLESFSDDYLFDNQILAVLIDRKVRFTQIGVETRYFPEAHTISLRRGMVYAAGCMGVAWKYFLHRKGLKPWPLVTRKIEK